MDTLPSPRLLPIPYSVKSLPLRRWGVGHGSALHLQCSPGTGWTRREARNKPSVYQKLVYNKNQFKCFVTRRDHKWCAEL